MAHAINISPSSRFTHHIRDQNCYRPSTESADHDTLLGHVTAPGRQDKSTWPPQRLPQPSRQSSTVVDIISPICTTVRLTFCLLLAFAVCSLLNGVLRPSYSNPPSHYRSLENKVRASHFPGRGNPHHDKVYVASNIINEHLIRGPWGRSLLSLIDLLGEENVFVSIYENDSGNATIAALQNLRDVLPCNASVVTGDHLSLASFPTVSLPNGEDRVPRLTYLSEVRNRLLWPLDASRSENSTSGLRSAANIKFDKILFLNDVYFDPLDAIQLLFSTNVHHGRARYRAACAIDFVRGAQMYDTFVVRDTEGFGTGFMVYPWFSTRGSGTSRQAVLRQTDAVPVRSCWGGMVAFDASVFQDDRSSDLSLRFHGSNESFWEAAECCLAFADMEERYGKPDVEKGSGVFINPYIRVAYSQSTWRWLPVLRRLERMFEYVQYIFSVVNYSDRNPRRTHEPGRLVEERVWNTSVRQFQRVWRRASPGGFCGQRKMFVMRNDLERANTDGSGKNWKKVSMPPGVD